MAKLQHWVSWCAIASFTRKPGTCINTDLPERVRLHVQIFLVMLSKMTKKLQISVFVSA